MLPCSEPYLSNLSPPAFVEAFPPIWQLQGTQREWAEREVTVYKCYSELVEVGGGEWLLYGREVYIHITWTHLPSLSSQVQRHHQVSLCQHVVQSLKNAPWLTHQDSCKGMWLPCDLTHDCYMTLTREWYGRLCSTCSLIQADQPVHQWEGHHHFIKYRIATTCKNIITQD